MADVSVEQKLREIKREARRRRILENADQRMKLITGDHQEPVYIKPINMIEEVVKPIETNSVEPETVEIAPTIINTFQADETSTVFDNFNLVITVVAVLTRIFLSNWLFRFMIIDSILMPFILLEIIFILCNNDKIKNSGSFLTMIVYMMNLPSGQVENIMFFMKIVENVGRDLALYFFTFLIFHMFISLFV